MRVLAYLTSLSVYEWSCILGAWVLLAIVAGVSLGRGMKRADDDTVPAVHAEPGPAREYDRITVMTELPPVPPSDATWLKAWPSGAHLVDFDAVHGLLSEEQVFPTADEAEQRVFDKLFDHLIAMSWPRERQDGAA